MVLSMFLVMLLVPWPGRPADLSRKSPSAVVSYCVGVRRGSPSREGPWDHFHQSSQDRSFHHTFLITSYILDRNEVRYRSWSTATSLDLIKKITLRSSLSSSNFLGSSGSKICTDMRKRILAKLLTWQCWEGDCNYEIQYKTRYDTTYEIQYNTIRYKIQNMRYDTIRDRIWAEGTTAHLTKLRG